MTELAVKQKKVADRSGVSVITIRELQNGIVRERQPSTLAAVAQALELPADALQRIADGEDPDDVIPTIVELSGHIGALSRVPDPTVQADNGVPEGVRFFSELDGWDRLTEEQQADIILGAQRATRGAATEGKDR